MARALRLFGQRVWRRLGGWLRRRPAYPVMLAPGSPALFPDPSDAPEHGLLAVGGDLSPERLLVAYRHGIFPWFNETNPILWWSPDPRAVFELGRLHISHRLARTVRSNKFRVTFDSAFPEVLEGCAEREEGTWITHDMMLAYRTLFDLGHAHSVEVWHNDQLAGGLYGVAVGGAFAGESMFTRVRDASKVALVHLQERLQERGFTLFDIQFTTDHTLSLGAVEISRAEYLRRLAAVRDLAIRFV